MKILVERADIVFLIRGRERSRIVWSTFYFKKENLFRLMIDGTWLPGSFVSQEKILEAYSAYRGQGFTVEVKEIKKIKAREVEEREPVVKTPRKRVRKRRSTLFD